MMEGAFLFISALTSLFISALAPLFINDDDDCFYIALFSAFEQPQLRLHSHVIRHE